MSPLLLVRLIAALTFVSYLKSIIILRTRFSEIDTTAISQSTVRSSHVVKDYQNSAINLTAGTAMEKRHLMNRTGIDIIPFYRYNSKVAVKVKSISIATHMSTEESLRFQRLLDMTSRWDGYISVAIYVKQSEKEEENLIKIINSFLDIYSNFFEDKVAIHLVIDRRKSRGSEFYPINFLRNIAMENTLTKLIMNLDIDFIPSLNSHNLLQSHMSHLENETKVVMILPSFERSLGRDEDWKSITSSELPSSKIQLMNEIKESYRKTKAGKKKVYSPFHLSLFNEGHEPTDFPRWYKTSGVYMVRFMSNFEPYYIVRKTNNLPQFWEHFTGFGKNKLSWVEEMAVAGYEFHVNPDAFLVHLNLSKQKKARSRVKSEYFQSFQPYLKVAYATRGSAIS